ncbi:MAG: hypothetical protein KDK78_00795 [Chlamydiia bacterium]|nr:hypothetical protein [Chlamydiia bacterium]
MEKDGQGKRIAYLEFVNDQLLTELKYVDQLLRSIGFPEGLETVKKAAREIQEMEEEDRSSPDESSELH